MGGGLSRREFFGATAVAAGLLSRQGTAAAPVGGRVTRIHKVYLAEPMPTWPRPDCDIKAEIRRIEGELARLSAGLAGVRLDGGDLYRVPDDVPASVEALGACHGLLVFNLAATVGEPLRRLAAMGLPTALFSSPHRGDGGSGVAALRSAGFGLTCHFGSDFSGVVRACRRIRMAHLSDGIRVAVRGEGSRRAARRGAAKEC